MSTHRHSGRIIPLCRGAKCDRNADMVVAFDSRDAQPYCFPCANATLRNAGGIGYPLEEFYPPGAERVTQFDPHEEPEFNIYNPDNPHEEFVYADNSGGRNSSVHPHDNC